MLGAMFIGLSGMNAYSSGLRQISNNISNLNTTGFKTSDVSFSDLFGLNAQEGGGYGVSLSDAYLNFDQGELRETDNDLDLAVDGDGLLVLEKGGEFFYARTGRFQVDNEGYIVLAGTDYRLTVIGEDGAPVSVNIDAYRSNPPTATTRIQLADNLSSTASNHTLSGVAVFDASGESDDWNIEFSRTETSPAGEWTVSVTDGEGNEIGQRTLRFNNGVVDADSVKLAFNDEQSGRSVELDFSENVSSFSSGDISTMRVSESDGFGIGEIATILVNENGQLEVGYSNEQNEDLGAVTLAHFRVSDSLNQLSNGVFSSQSETGRQFLTSTHTEVGQVLSSRIEASNVDLSAEFGDLILVQRGYQASSQVVSVSNDMIQQLFGIRGQG